MLEQGLIDVLGGLTLALCNKDAGSSTVCTMALEVVNALINHEVSLNPALPLAVRLNEDTPALAQVCLSPPSRNTKQTGGACNCGDVSTAADDDADGGDDAAHGPGS